MDNESTVVDPEGVGSYTTVSARSFDVVTAADEQPRIGIRITPHDGEVFVLPIEYRHAKWLAEDILKTIYQHAPELFDIE